MMPTTRADHIPEHPVAVAFNEMFISKFKIRDDILQTPKIHLTKSLIFKPKSVGFVCFFKKVPDNIPNLCCSGSSGPLLITHTGQSS